MRFFFFLKLVEKLEKKRDQSKSLILEKTSHFFSFEKKVSKIIKIIINLETQALMWINFKSKKKTKIQENYYDQTEINHQSQFQNHHLKIFNLLQIFLTFQTKRSNQENLTKINPSKT